MSRIRRLVIIDDDPGTRTMLRNAAEAAGWWVDHGSTADDVWRSLAAADALVVGMHLQDLSGLDLLATLRGQGLTMPTLMLAADARPEAEASALANGAAALLLKPVDSGALLAALDAACSSASNPVIDLTDRRDITPQRATSAS